MATPEETTTARRNLVDLNTEVIKILLSQETVDDKSWDGIASAALVIREIAKEQAKEMRTGVHRSIESIIDELPRLS